MITVLAWCFMHFCFILCLVCIEKPNLRLTIQNQRFGFGFWSIFGKTLKHIQSYVKLDIITKCDNLVEFILCLTLKEEIKGGKIFLLEPNQYEKCELKSKISKAAALGATLCRVQDDPFLQGVANLSLYNFFLPTACFLRPTKTQRRLEESKLFHRSKVNCSNSAQAAFRFLS